jgi:putative membrane protein
MRRLLCLAAILGVLVLATSAKAQPSGSFDQMFLRSEARSSAYEAAIAQLAQGRATDPEVKAYADALAKDHEAYGGTLRDLAKKKGMTLETGLSAQSKAALDRMSRLHGRSFDRAFIAEAVRVNSAAMRAFRAEAARTSDPEIRAFVRDHLAMDERHDAAARALLRRLTPRSRSGMPVIRPPMTGSMPVIPPPSSGTTPIIPPPR